MIGEMCTAWDSSLSLASIRVNRYVEGVGSRGLTKDAIQWAASVCMLGGGGEGMSGAQRSMQST
jgi:hypothetical protein